jgi:hypothetical protein
MSSVVRAKASPKNLALLMMFLYKSWSVYSYASHRTGLPYTCESIAAFGAPVVPVENLDNCKSSKINNLAVDIPEVNW